jgi:hypothetical protein
MLETLIQSSSGMNTFRKPTLLVFGIGAIVISQLPARAAVAPVIVFDSFGPGNSFLNSVVWGVSGASTSYGYRGQAEWFVPTISGYLSSFTLATYRQSGSGLSDFYIAEDSGSGPGTIMESFLDTANNPNGLLTINSTVQPLLQAGVKYWLCDEPADSTTSNGWYENNQNYLPGFAFETSPWSWSVVNPPYVPPSGVFRVTVIPVPEPSIAGLLAFGVFLLARPRRQGVSPDNLQRTRLQLSGCRD